MPRLTARRCLIVEKHDWETGAFQHQLQIPLHAAQAFFGTGASARSIRLRVFMPPNATSPTYERQVSVSKKYSRSATRRINGFHDLGSIPSCFMFIQETGTPDVYNFWWQTDKAIVAARYTKWVQGQNSQHGRGRLVNLVRASVPRVINKIA